MLDLLLSCYVFMLLVQWVDHLLVINTMEAMLGSFKQAHVMLIGDVALCARVVFQIINDFLNKWIIGQDIFMHLFAEVVKNSIVNIKLVLTYLGYQLIQ